MAADAVVRRMRRSGCRALADHGLAAGAPLFRWLEDHDGRAVEVAGLGEVFRGAEQHGRMAVMATGVH